MKEDYGSVFDKVNQRPSDFHQRCSDFPGGKRMAELRTIDEAAAWLRVPTETLRYWRKLGRGPKAAKVGKHLRYRDEELRRWLKEQEGQGARPT
jgi:hypothetical protein